jgi:hypothetical protein
MAKGESRRLSPFAVRPGLARATSDQIESKIQSDRIKLLAKIKAGAFSD